MSAKRRHALPIPVLAAMLLAALLAAGPAAGERYEVGGDSHVLAITGKAGLLGALGHRHAILGTEVAGEICFDPGQPEATKARVTVPTATLEVDGERARELAEIGKGPGADDVPEIQADMLSERYLAAEKHPQIVFTLSAAERKARAKYVARGSFELRGVERDVQVPVVVLRGDDGALVVTGRFTVKQTDHGFEPASVGGVVNVADEVVIEVRLVGEAAEGPCDG